MADRSAQRAERTSGAGIQREPGRPALADVRAALAALSTAVLPRCLAAISRRLDGDVDSVAAQRELYGT